VVSPWPISGGDTWTVVVSTGGGGFDAVGSTTGALVGKAVEGSGVAEGSKVDVADGAFVGVAGAADAVALGLRVGVASGPFASFFAPDEQASSASENTTAPETSHARAKTGFMLPSYRKRKGGANRDQGVPGRGRRSTAGGSGGKGACGSVWYQYAVLE